jgi:hypothetical protein
MARSVGILHPSCPPAKHIRAPLPVSFVTRRTCIETRSSFFWVTRDGAFFLFPVFSGALLLVLIGWLYNNAVRKTPYPQYW